METEQLISERAHIFNKAYKVIRFEYPYASDQFHREMAYKLEKMINEMDLPIDKLLGLKG